MCKNATYLPDENQYEPCHECYECNGAYEDDMQYSPVASQNIVDVENDDLPF